MRTFEELAQVALGQEPTHMVVQELAQAMHRLEYNLAFQLAHSRLSANHIPMSEHAWKVLIDVWLSNLRAEIPQ